MASPAKISLEKRIRGAKGLGPWSHLFAVHLGFVSLVWVAEEQSPMSVCIPAVPVASAIPGAVSALDSGSRAPDLVTLLGQHCRTHLWLLPELQVG